MDGNNDSTDSKYNSFEEVKVIDDNCFLHTKHSSISSHITFDLNIMDKNDQEQQSATKPIINHRDSTESNNGNSDVPNDPETDENILNGILKESLDAESDSEKP